MRTRRWEGSDTGEIRAIHHQMEIGYALPDVHSPLFGLKRILESDTGDVIGGGAIKPVGECFLWVAPDLPPVLRARAFCRLAGEARELAAKSGYDELSAWIPPHIQTMFQGALRRSGWTASPWPSWSVKL